MLYGGRHNIHWGEDIGSLEEQAEYITPALYVLVIWRKLRARPSRRRYMLNSRSTPALLFCYAGEKVTSERQSRES